eukprot:tig00000025_g7910.t1
MGYTERAGSAGTAHGQPPSPAASLPPPPASLIDALAADQALPLGRGQFGAVYQVYYRARALAVKVVPVTGEASEQNQSAVREPRGISILRRCAHPNILPLEEAYADDGNIYMVFPLASYSLAQLLAARGPLEPQRALSYLVQIAQGLRYLHHGLSEQDCIVHRDLKPANVLVFDMDRTVRLCDFGIARHVGTLSTFFGQTDYLPPEARTETLNPPAGYDARKIDVWSFGIMIVECFTSQKPFQAGAAHAPYPDALLDGLGAVHPTVPLLVRACLAGEAGARPSIEQILAALLRLAGGPA